jgi:hypothetical protein
MMKKKIILGLAFMMAMLSAPLQAQILSRGDLFGPGAPPPMIGVELGLGLHTQEGQFQADCGCTFPSGSGNGFLGGLLFELPVSYQWTFGLGLKFDLKGYKTSVFVTDTATIYYTANDSVSRGNIDFQRNGTVKETFFTLAPFVRYDFFRNGPFIQAGPGIGFVLTNHFTHTRDLLTSTVTLQDNTQISNVSFENGTRSQVLQDGKIDNALGTRISAILTAGWNIPVGDNAVIAPMFTYDLPFTKVRDDILAQGWKIQSMFFTVGLKYKLE